MRYQKIAISALSNKGRQFIITTLLYVVVFTVGCNRNDDTPIQTKESLRTLAMLELVRLHNKQNKNYIGLAKRGFAI